MFVEEIHKDNMHQKYMSYSLKSIKYLTAIIVIELIVYAGINFQLLNYTEPAITLMLLAVLLGFNFLYIEKGWFMVARLNIVFIALTEITLNEYVWFDQSAGFFMYYILVIAIAFILFRFNKKTERHIIIGILSAIGILFLGGNILFAGFVPKPLSKGVNNALYFIATLTTMSGIGAFMWMYAVDANEQQAHLDRLANTDVLTGILNRRAFFNKADMYFKSIKDQGEELSLMIIDVDYFKRVNDTYGHPVGDLVLKELSRLITGMVPKEAIFARYGGEEFAVLIPNVGMQQTIALAEALREMIYSSPLAIDETTKVGISISIGIAAVDRDVESMEVLIQIADKNLYRAKETGRNKVVCLRA